jgi:hypothetical protein
VLCDLTLFFLARTGQIFEFLLNLVTGSRHSSNATHSSARALGRVRAPRMDDPHGHACSAPRPSSPCAARTI